MNKEELTLKDFIEEIFKKNPWHAMNTARDLIELEAIENRINILWGVEFEIKVKPAEKREGRFYGIGLVSAIEKNSDTPNQPIQ